MHAWLMEYMPTIDMDENKSTIISPPGSHMSNPFAQLGRSATSSPSVAHTLQYRPSRS